MCALLLIMLCGCFCCYRHRKGKESRAEQMRRNIGYTPDMEAKGEGNFGPTNKHVAITRGGGAQVTPEMLATKSYTQPTYPPTHHRAPSEAPSSVIEDNIANNYRPKTAAKVCSVCSRALCVRTSDVSVFVFSWGWSGQFHLVFAPFHS